MAIVCKWKKTEGGWKLWRKGRPSVCGEGGTYEEAREALIGAIQHSGVSVLQEGPLEFDPPLPPAAEAERFMKPELYLLGGGEGFGGEVDPQAEYFEGGFCPTCGCGVGARTGRPIILSRVSKADGAYTTIHGYQSRTLFSEDFLSLLTPEERERFDFRPVAYHERCNKRKCDYYELSADSPVPFVGIQGYEADGISCRTCGHREINYYKDKAPLSRFLCLSDLPDPPPSCFPVGSHQRPHLCMTRQRWDEIRGHKFTKGIVSQAVGVVPEALCERNPDQHNLSGKCDTCKGWIEPTNEKGDYETRYPYPFNQAHVIENFQWIRQAEQAGELEIVRSTKSYEDLLKLIQSGHRPEQEERLWFRCTGCRILETVKVTPEEVYLGWSGSKRRRAGAAGPVKLVCSILVPEAGVLDRTKETLQNFLGPADLISEAVSVTEAAAGPSLGIRSGVRILLSFHKPADPAKMKEVKIVTEALEHTTAEISKGGLVRLIPGYVMPEKVVLALKHNKADPFYSTHDVEVQEVLVYQEGQWHPNAFTPGDFQEPLVQSFLSDVRERLVRQLQQIGKMS